MFHPWIVTPTHLGSVAIVTLKLALPLHSFLMFFWIFLLPPPSYRPPHMQPFIFKVIYNLHLLPTSNTSAKRHPPGLRPHLPPASLHRSSLRPAPCACVCRRYCDCPPPPPPFAALGLRPGTCHPLEVFPVTVPPLLCAPTLNSPSSLPNNGTVRSLVSLLGWIFVGGREARMPPLPGSR